jgi:predicted nucleic acid-binding Zn ribbon protein
VRSSAGPDERDPALLGGAIDRLIVNRGWDLNVATGQLHAGWAEMIGHTNAQHVSIETFDLDPSGQSGVLVLRADSTTWATQIRYLLASLQTQLDESIGFGRVSEIVVNGPTAPSWKHGLRSVKGRGPRDTYG